MWRRILTLSTLAAFLISVPTGFAKPNLAGWWRFDEGNGTTAYDSAGDNDGTLVNGPTWTTGQIGGALGFDGDDDYVELGTIGGTDDLALAGSNFTICSWIKPNLTGDGWQRIVDKSNGIRGANGYAFWVHTNGMIAIHVNGNQFTSDNSVITSGIWQHVVVTGDGNDYQFYVDGLPTSGSFNLGSYNPPPSVTTNMRIGTWNHSTGREFNGSIDDVRIYNRALSAEEIKELYREGSYKAFAPNPADGAVGVDPNAVLSWSPGKYAASHDVYFGTDYNDVNDANTSSPEYKGNQDVNSWDPCGLDLLTTYYWRIDEVNEPNLWKGNVWSFETAGPEIGLSATQFEFYTFEGGANPNDQILSISNSGAGTINWQIAYDCNWLDVEPNNGSSTGEVDDVNLSVDISGLVKGIYICNLIVSDVNATNSPQIVGVNLYVRDADGQLHVPSEYPTIQAAIDDSINGETVIVAPGTYTGTGNRNIDFLGKAITVRSNDPNDPNVVNATVIDCESLNRGFVFNSGEEPDSVLAGLTIINGYKYGAGGGGIYCGSSSPKIKKCVITNNSCYYSGGNSNNISGGGIYCSSSSPIIEDCVISDNSCSASYYNYARGGGIFFAGGNPTISGSAITNNTTMVGGQERHGGGIFCTGMANLVISKCVISNNSAIEYGGGFCCRNSSITISNSIISGNWGRMGGGGLYLQGCSSTINGCTIVANDAPYGGGSAIYDSSGTALLSNSIIWDNGLTGFTSGEVTYCDVQNGFAGTGNIDLDPFFVYPEIGDYHLAAISPCINAGDPNYSPAPEEQDIDGDLRIINSRIDMGADEFTGDGPTVIYISPTEFEFTTEIGINPDLQVLAIQNIGAGTLNWQITEGCFWLEADPNSGSSTGEVDDVNLMVDVSGLSWGNYDCDITISDPNAYNSPKTVTVSLEVFGPIIELSDTWFKFSFPVEGGNPPDQIVNISNSGVLTLNWTIDYDCNWLTVEPQSGSSTGDINEVILSVDINGLDPNDFYACDLTVSDPNAENNPQIITVELFNIINVKADGTGDYPTIQAAINASTGGDVIILQPGTYTGTGNRDIDFKGKAITVRSTDPCNPDVVAATIIDCQGTSSSLHRGFYFHSGEDGNSVLSGLTIKNGYADEGSGIYCSDSSPIISHCTITGNRTTDGSSEVLFGDPGGPGGGIYCYNSSAKIANCTIKNNQTGNGGSPGVRYGGDGGPGGGIYCWNYSSHLVVRIANCIISNNQTGNGGNGSSECWPDPWIGGGGNGGDGGGICLSYNTPAQIVNCIISGNQTGNGGSYDDYCDLDGKAGNGGNGGGIFTSSGNDSSPTIKNCIITNNTTGSGGNCSTADDPGDGGDGGGICCDYSSPQIINCTTTSNETGAGGANPYEDGSPGEGGGIFCQNGSVTVTNSIMWDDTPEEIYAAGSVAVTYSDVQGGWTGEGNINADPCFVSGSQGDYYLSQIAAGQTSNSPCVDSGSDTAANLGMDIFTTRTDRIQDTGIVDMGYHYPAVISSADIDENWYVDLFDYAILAADWLKCLDPCDSNGLPGDIIKEGCVDIEDLKALVHCWLDCYVSEAMSPSPDYNEFGVDPNVILSWSAGIGALYHDVYFGTDYNDVNDATTSSPEYIGQQDSNSWDPCGLDLLTTYYWRIDEIGPACSAKGNVWYFTTWGPFDPNLGLVSWWRFDEGSSSIAYDSAGGNHGTIYGATWTTGQIDGALDFDGVNDYISVPDDPSFSINATTVIAWVKGNAQSGNTIAAQYDWEAGERAWALRSWEGEHADKIRVLISDDGSSNAAHMKDYSGEGLTAFDDNWHQIAFTFDGSDLKLYVDAVEETSIDKAKDGAISSIYDTDVDLTIGSLLTSGSPTNHFDGKIDDVRIYNRALDAGEIWRLYQDGL